MRDMTLNEIVEWAFNLSVLEQALSRFQILPLLAANLQ